MAHLLLSAWSDCLSGDKLLTGMEERYRWNLVFFGGGVQMKNSFDEGFFSEE